MGAMTRTPPNILGAALLVALVSSSSSSPAASSSSISVDVANNGSYSISVVMAGGSAASSTWLESGPTFLRTSTASYSTSDGSLKLVKPAEKVTGSDPKLGSYEGYQMTWAAGDSTPFVTEIQVFSSSNIVVFEQSFPEGLKGVGQADLESTLLSGFPTFSTASAAGDAATPPLGYLTFSGRFLEASRAGQWTGGSYPDGRSAGPLALFDAEMRSAVVVGPLNNFMAASFGSDGTMCAGKTMCMGLMGSLSELPPGFKHSTIMMVGSGQQPTPGVAGAVKEWGNLMLGYYGKDPAKARAADPSLHVLGFSTDNGAL